MTPIEPEIVFRRNLEPPQQLRAWEWAERNIVLSTRQATGFPGPYRTSLTPYVRGMFDALQDPAVNTVVVEKGAQTGLTLTAYVWLCWTICEDPGPALLVYPSEKQARSASETRMMPLVDDSPAVAAQKSDDRDEWTKLQYRMRSCTVNWEGSNSPANLASRPIRYLILDEVDKYPTQNAREATPCALAEQRTKTFWNRTILKMSTPTTPDGLIHSAYEAGDQRKYFVPCPGCGAMQQLVWGQVKFDSELDPAAAAVGAYYECIGCGRHLADTDKPKMLDGGEWRATHTTGIRGVASFHLSSLYAPWTTWAGLVDRFLRVKGIPGELQDFINSELGEPFVRDTVHVSSSVITDREGEYGLGERFTETDLYRERYAEMRREIVVGVDVQKECLIVVAREFCENGDSGLVTKQLMGTFGELAEWVDAIGAYDVAVDCGYRTQEVYEYSLRHRFTPCKGSSFRVPGIWEQTSRNIDEGTRRQREGRSVGIILHDSAQLKDQLYDLVTGRSPFVWLVPRGSGNDLDYVQQMTAEHRDERGRWLPVRPGAANHFWDCEVMCLLLATMYGFNAHVRGGDNEQDED